MNQIVAFLAIIPVLAFAETGSLTHAGIPPITAKPYLEKILASGCPEGLPRVFHFMSLENADGFEHTRSICEYFSLLTRSFKEEGFGFVELESVLSKEKLLSSMSIDHCDLTGGDYAPDSTICTAQIHQTQIESHASDPADFDEAHLHNAGTDCLNHDITATISFRMMPAGILDDSIVLHDMLIQHRASSYWVRRCVY